MRVLTLTAVTFLVLAFGALSMVSTPTASAHVSPCFESDDDPDCVLYGCYWLGPLGSDCFGIHRHCNHNYCFPPLP